MTELVTLDPATSHFTARWTDEAGLEMTEEFFVEDKLSIARYRMFQKFQREIVTGLSHFDLIQLLKNNVANLNDAMQGGKVLAQMSYENINALNHAGNLEAKEPFEVWLCTLVINTKHEDRRTFDLPTMQNKIRIWEGAGIDMGFFTSIAEHLCGLPSGALRSPILTYLERTEMLTLNNVDEIPLVSDPTTDPNT